MNNKLHHTTENRKVGNSKIVHVILNVFSCQFHDSILALQKTCGFFTPRHSTTDLRM